MNWTRWDKRNQAVRIHFLSDIFVAVAIVVA